MTDQTDAVLSSPPIATESDDDANKSEDQPVDEEIALYWAQTRSQPENTVPPSGQDNIALFLGPEVVSLSIIYQSGKTNNRLVHKPV